MIEAHTKGRIKFKEDGDANHYSMLTEDGRWWLAVLANGEQTSERQIANFRRLAACWNRLEPFTTEQIEDPGFDLTGAAVTAEEMRSFSVLHQKLQRRFNQLEEERDQLKSQRDQLLEALQGFDKAMEEASDWPDTSTEREVLSRAVTVARAAIAAVEGGQP